MDLIQFMGELSSIQYGWWYEKEKKIITFNDPKFDQEGFFEENYHILKPDDVWKHNCGTCWDLTLLIFSALSGLKYQKEIYKFPCNDVQAFYYESRLPKNKSGAMHSSVLFQESHSKKYFWIEYSWFQHRGIHGPFDTKEQFFNIFEKYFVKPTGEILTLLNKSFDAEALLKLDVITVDDFVSIARKHLK